MDENGTCVFMASSPSKISALYMKMELCEYDLCNEDICFGSKPPDHPPSMDKNLVFWCLIGAAIAGGCSLLVIVFCLVKCLCGKCKQKSKIDTETRKKDDRLRGTYSKSSRT